MLITVIRETDEQTFTLNSHAYGPYMLDTSTTIPSGTSLDVTGYEYSGRDGGYSTSSRMQRYPFDLSFMIREDWTTTSGLFELLRDAKAFFDPHQDNLTSNLYTIQFYSEDRANTAFMLRHGTITVPLQGKTYPGECRMDAQVSFIFGDPNLYPLGESGVTLQLFAGGQSSDVGGRRFDDDDGALWDVTDGKIWEDTGGSGDPVKVDIVSTATVPVSIVADGQLIDPQIINLTNDSSFSYNGTIEDGDTLTVDTAGNVLLNGGTPTFTYSGSLTAQDGLNTFALLAAIGSPGSATLTILGAF